MVNMKANGFHLYLYILAPQVLARNVLRRIAAKMLVMAMLYYQVMLNMWFYYVIKGKIIPRTTQMQNFTTQSEILFYYFMTPFQEKTN